MLNERKMTPQGEILIAVLARRKWIDLNYPERYIGRLESRFAADKYIYHLPNIDLYYTLLIPIYFQFLVWQYCPKKGLIFSISSISSK